MGGAAGHIKQIWEATEVPFGDLRKLVYNSLEGTLENVSEKLDGQNILITYKDGKALCARTIEQVRNFGEQAMNIEFTRIYFAQRGNPYSVQRTFVNAVKDFDSLFNESSVKFKKVFEEGKYWLNVEILSVDTENIIPYFKDQLCIHHLIEYDENGKKIQIIDLEFTAKQMETFLICKTNKVTMGCIDRGLRNELMSYFESLINGFNDEETIGDFMEYKMEEYIEENINDEQLLINSLALRWGKGIKDPNITSLLKYTSYETSVWVREEDKNIKEKYDEILHPFVFFFSKLGVIILKHLGGLVTRSKEVAVSNLSEKLHDAIANVSSVGLEKHLVLLNELGINNSVVPTEGIVFEFDDQLYKLTGSFTPILRIIGTHRFGA